MIEKPILVLLELLPDSYLKIKRGVTSLKKENELALNAMSISLRLSSVQTRQSYHLQFFNRTWEVGRQDLQSLEEIDDWFWKLVCVDVLCV